MAKTKVNTFDKLSDEELATKYADSIIAQSGYSDFSKQLAEEIKSRHSKGTKDKK